HRRHERVLPDVPLRRREGAGSGGHAQGSQPRHLRAPGLHAVPPRHQELSPAMEPRELLRHLYDVAVARALPGRVLADHLPPPPKGRTLVLGAGKAGGSMAEALEAAWPEDASLSGLVITRYDHKPPSYTPRRIELVEAAHPVPDAAGERAAAR